jgi:glycosyltransferase involved in cell wall biosynthesis
VTVRVLWVVKGLGPGGAERLLVAAARTHDPERVRLECAYVLPHKDHLAAALEDAGVRCTCLSHRAHDPAWPLALRTIVGSGRYDVVHVHSPVPGSVARAAARTVPADRRPVTLSTEHNTWAGHRLPTRWANRWTSRWDAATFAVSEQTRSSLAGPAAARAQVLTHGIDVAAVAAQRASRDAVREELGLDPHEWVVGTVANLTPQKDYPTLLAAAALLRDRGVPATVVAVGQGPLESEVRAQVDALGLTGTVRLTGFRDDAVRVMAAFDVFTLASAWEGLPVALMEALALGLPVVATAVGGVAEVLTDGVDAVLVPSRDPAALADAWAATLADGELRTRLASASSALAGRFDVAPAVRVLEDTYVRLAERRPSPPDQEARPQIPTVPPVAPAGARAATGLDIRPAVEADRPAVLDLLRRSLGADDPRYEQFFAWKHDANPFGASPMWVATDGGAVVAFRTFLRWEFERGGRVVPAVRAVDTVTDAGYRGRGLFRALTLQALDDLRADGVAFVFNTPNSSSRPGYLSMGWRDVGRPPVAVHVRRAPAVARVLRSRVAADRWSLPSTLGVAAAEWLEAPTVHLQPPPARHVRELRTHLTVPFLRWRYGTALLGYRVLAEDDHAVVVRLRRRGSATELAVVAGFGPGQGTDRLAREALAVSGADYALRLGGAGHGFVPAPGAGPRLTWRALADAGMPPLPSWALDLGDVELF